MLDFSMEKLAPDPVCSSCSLAEGGFNSFVKEIKLSTAEI